MSKIIRISEAAFDKLNKLEEEMRASKQLIIETALDRLSRENLFKRAQRAYEEERANPQAYSETQAEFAEWESTLNDGLEDL